MRFNIKTEKPLEQLAVGFGLVYETKGAEDQGVTYSEIIKRDPIRVGIIDTIHERFTRVVNDCHLGVFPQSRPKENKDVFKSWLQETYHQIPEAAKYLFE